MPRSTSGALDATFVALSDGTRRDMIRSLLHKPRRAGELADIVAMTPQALSRHLRVLRSAGLVNTPRSRRPSPRSSGTARPRHARFLAMTGMWRGDQMSSLRLLANP